MEKLKEFFRDFDWKRAGKLALVIVPVLLWEVWHTTIKYIDKANRKIDRAGERLLCKFMDGK